MQIAIDLTPQTRKAVSQQQEESAQIDKASRQPRLVERDNLVRRADKLSLGAMGCAVLTGVGAIVAMPVAYLTLSNPTARALTFTVPVLVPAFAGVVLVYKAGQEWRAALALQSATHSAAPEVVVENATTTTHISELDL